jgi:hypothetical protein
MRGPLRRYVLLLLLTVLVGGCAARSARIGDLTTNPAPYYDRTVRLEGHVTSSWGVPLLPVRIYRIHDGTGEITVVSRGGRAPTRGARVRVTGTVSELAVLGGQSVGLHLQERSLNVLQP